VHLLERRDGNAVLGDARGSEAKHVVGEPIGVVWEAADVGREHGVPLGEGSKTVAKVEVGAADVIRVFHGSHEFGRAEGYNKKHGEDGGNSGEARNILSNEKEQKNGQRELKVVAATVVHLHLVRGEQQKHQKQTAERKHARDGVLREPEQHRKRQKILFVLGDVEQRDPAKITERIVSHFDIERIGERVMEVVPPEKEIGETQEQREAKPTQLL
jgi:hypothetical protein